MSHFPWSSVVNYHFCIFTIFSTALTLSSSCNQENQKQASTLICFESLCINKIHSLTCHQSFIIKDVLDAVSCKFNAQSHCMSYIKSNLLLSNQTLQLKTTANDMIFRLCLKRIFRFHDMTNIYLKKPSRKTDP